MSLQSHVVGVLIVLLISRSAIATTYQFVDITPPGLHSYDVVDVEGIVGGMVFGAAPNAGYWTGGASSFVSVAGPTYSGGTVRGSDGTYEVGNEYDAPQSSMHAILWAGTAASAVDLNPSNYAGSFALGVSNGIQVGYAYNGSTDQHAMLWTGTAASAVDLHPQGFIFSAASSVLNGREVGGAWLAANSEHAGIWYGSAASFVDINPAGFTGSTAFRQSQDQIVGWGTPQSNPASDTSINHALLWNATGTSAVDLNPAGFLMSIARDTNGMEQVGDAYLTDGGSSPVHPYVWSGSAASGVDLISYLPAGYSESELIGINDQGIIVGAADYYDPKLGSGFRAYELVPVPEPTTGLLILSGCLLLRRRFRR